LNYYEKRLVSASLIKKCINADSFNIDDLEYWHNDNTKSEAMTFGTKLHSYILENANVVPNYEFIKSIFDLIGGEREVDIYKDMFNVPCKSKIDLLTDNCVIDLKTTSNIYDVKSAISKYNYDISMEFYSLMTGINKLAYFFVSKTKEVSYFYMPIKSDWRIRQSIIDCLEINKDLFIKWSKL
jgi:hypothetical protein